MEPYEVIVNQPVVIDNVSRFTFYINSSWLSGNLFGYVFHKLKLKYFSLFS